MKSHLKSCARYEASPPSGSHSDLSWLCMVGCWDQVAGRGRARARPRRGASPRLARASRCVLRWGIFIRFRFLARLYSHAAAKGERRVCDGAGGMCLIRMRCSLWTCAHAAASRDAVRIACEGPHRDRPRAHPASRANKLEFTAPPSLAATLQSAALPLNHSRAVWTRLAPSPAPARQLNEAKAASVSLRTNTSSHASGGNV